MAGLEEYKFGHKYRGLALIFVHENFKGSPSLAQRAGALVDAKKMRNLFESLDFKVKVYKDLTRQKIFEKLQKAADSKYNMDSDCFACVFSTHGEEAEDKDRKQGFITWKNCIYGYDCEPIIVDEILSMFSNKKCHNLADKPKLFFIQACRSRHTQSQHRYDFGGLMTLIRQRSRESGQGDSGSQDSADNISLQQSKGNTEAEQGSEMDSANQSLSRLVLGNSGIEHLDDVDEIQEIRKVVDIYKDWIEDPDGDELHEIPESIQPEEDEADSGGAGDSGIIPEPPVEVTPITCPNDCLVVYPVMPGRIAFRNKRNGSWLLHYLFEELDILLDGGNLLAYLTAVCRRSAQYEYNPDPIPQSLTPREALNLPFKTSAVVIHRLVGCIRFEPKAKKSFMGKVCEIRKKLLCI